MDYFKKNINGVSLEISLFSENGVEEIHLIAKPEAQGDFSQQLASVIQAQYRFLEESRISRDSLVFSRYFVSDYANQERTPEWIQAHSPSNVRLPALSIVQQPPLSGQKVTVWSYIIHDKNKTAQDSTVLDNNSLLVKRGTYRHLWSTRLLSTNVTCDSHEQTDNILQAYNGQLERNGFSFKDNCIRTWLFVKDIDFNYQGVVVARRRLFDEIGLTAKTHFIASTGIEGRHANPQVNVLFDAYSVNGISSVQIKFLEALDHLNPTHEYGVTFERGTAIDYGDRRHIFISGTASINNKGEVLHTNNVCKQVVRALENIDALLADAASSMQNVAQMIVYLRDLADTPAVISYLEENYPEIPKVFTLAPVCRPGWLVEIECVAIKSVKNSTYANF